MPNNNNIEYQQKLQNARLYRLSNINLSKCIRIFICVYESLNIHIASNRIHASISSISRTISLLEDAVGEKFFYRNGRNGMTVTENGKMFYNYAVQFMKTIRDINNIGIENRLEKNIINIEAHPLAVETYIFPALKNLMTHENCKTSYSLTTSLGEKIINNIKNNITDIAICPMENEELNILKTNGGILNAKRLKEYNLCLYMNKQNRYSKMDEKLFEANDLNSINIAPFPYGFGTFNRTMNNNYYFLNTKTFDIKTLYDGIVNNFWTVGIGDEFEKIFDCSNFSKKEYNNMNCCSVKIYWTILTKKEQKKNLTQIIRTIVNVMS